MVMRQVYVTYDDEMWFVVNDRPFRFSRLEYALITWLDCSDNFPEEVLEVSDFCGRHFQGSNKVSVNEVEMRLKDLKSVDELLSIERVKMACLYFVCGVLWPIAPVKNPQVDKKVISLIDDFDIFNEYPCGTIAFKSAVFDLIKKEFVLSEKVEKGKFSNSGTHDMIGFIYPLQILAYECVRGIGERFAKQREGDNATLPRMCQCISNKWPKKGSLRYIDILDASKSGKNVSIFSCVDGYCRRWSSVPWANASSILIPLNLHIHWVALVVNVKDGTIAIYDCNHRCYTDAEMDVYIQPVEYVVKHLLHYCKVKIPDIWTITRPKDFPQNATSSGCGAWMIKTFEVELSQQSPYSLTDEIVNSYRKYLAISVWYGE